MYDDEAPVSIGQWLVAIVLFSVPVVNFIYFIVLLTGNGNRSLVNFARAYGIILGAFMVIGAIFCIACFGLVVTFFDTIVQVLESFGLSLPF